MGVLESMYIECIFVYMCVCMNVYDLIFVLVFGCIYICSMY